MSAEFSEQIDLRAHHLHSLAQQYRSPRLTKAVKKVKLALLGYRDSEFADQITNVIGGIIDGDIKKVRITDGYDEICKKCPQKKETHYKVAEKEWSPVFLSLVDQKIAENSALEIGGIYDSNELIARIGTIREGIRKTLIQIPSLLEIARLLEQSEK